MRTRHRWTFLLASAVAVIGTSAIPAAAASQAASVPNPAVTSQAVAYQGSIAHDGYSADTTLAPPLHRRWARTLSGPISYPLIAGGKVFVTAVSSPGGSYGTTLYALNQVTGATVWSQRIGGPYYWSAAAYDAGRVFVVNSGGLLTAFEAASGAAAWSVQLPGQYMFSSPPTADGGMVYVGGAGSGGTLYAVQESDGTVMWTQPVMNGDNSSPALSATSVFVSYACGVVYAFDRVTGQPQWFNNGPCEGGGGKTAVYHAGQVFTRDFFGNEVIDAATGITVGGFQADVAPAFSGNVGLFLGGGALVANNGTTMWTFKGDGGLDTAPIVAGSTVFVGSSSGKLYGLSLAKGKVVWSTKIAVPIPGPDEQNGSQPLTGLGAGQALLVVPAGSRLVAFAH